MTLARARIFSPLLLIAVLVAGCGSSSSSSSPSGASNSAAASSSTTGGGYSRGSSYGSGGSSSSSSSSGTVMLTTKSSSKLGTILAAGSKKMTVYLFQADKGGKSACSGTCATAWPPVTGKAQVGGAASSGKLGTITRSDGKTQVTYNGHPLYFFIKDKDGADAYGQAVKAFGAEWYTLAPSGNKVDKS